MKLGKRFDIIPSPVNINSKTIVFCNEMSKKIDVVNAPKTYERVFIIRTSELWI